MSLALRVLKRIGDLTEQQWNALLGGDDNPFVSHAFLYALEQSGSVRKDYGWQAHHLALYEDDQLIAACPAYLKSNSHGEFVFDWAWAGAYARHGMAYYPKLLCAIPYSPVTGPRLLAKDEAARHALLEAIVIYVERMQLSSAHLNFLQAADIQATQAQPDHWLARFDVQFQWHKRANWGTFDDFLAALSPKKRKNIKQERAKVARELHERAWRIDVLEGAAITPTIWQALHQLYELAFELKGNTPALTEAFFQQFAAARPTQTLACLVRDSAQTVQAMAVYFRSKDVLYGRYWGAQVEFPGLHFECCYYQGIQYCLQHGISRFEPGAQGEHKLARGFLPTRVHSAHYIHDPRFRRAIADALSDEAEQRTRYEQYLQSHNPFAPE